ncbi:hypothetical protein R3P38DRAFT_2791521 [Favolaschia claudopus]|uniref:F-box domain-containing protein n=1 Tax=Favolaschia claudopus TaxID=2862362 RepID=A0AAW0AIG2_9AGAR
MANNSRCSAIVHIPAEVTEEILAHSLQSSYSWYSEMALKRTLIHTSYFWTTLVLEINVPTPYLLFLIQRAISTKKLLDVTIDTGNTIWEGLFGLIPLRALGDGGELLRTVFVLTQGQRSLALILGAMRIGQALRLERVEFSLDAERVLDRPTALPGIPSPFLTSVSLEKVIPIWDDDGFLNNTKELRLGGFHMTLSWHRLCAVLTASSKVNSLALLDLRCEGLPILVQPVAMPQVTSFELLFGHPEDITIVNYIYMPNATTVKVIGLRNAPWDLLFDTCSDLLLNAKDLTIALGPGELPSPTLFYTFPVLSFLDVRNCALEFVNSIVGHAGSSSDARYPCLQRMVTFGGMTTETAMAIAACTGAEKLVLYEALNRVDPYNFCRWTVVGAEVEKLKLYIENERQLRS